MNLQKKVSLKICSLEKCKKNYAMNKSIVMYVYNISYSLLYTLHWRQEATKYKHRHFYFQFYYLTTLFASIVHAGCPEYFPSFYTKTLFESFTI